MRHRLLLLVSATLTLPLLAAPAFANPTPDVVYTRDALQHEIWNGAGWTRDSYTYPRGRYTTGVAMADFDGDGFLDVMAAPANQGAYAGLCLNDGNGRISGGWAPLVPRGCSYSATHGIAVDFDPMAQGPGIEPMAADFDGDGISDIAFSGNRNVCLNDGDANFTCAGIGTPNGRTYGGAAADVNGDGAPDLLFSRWDRVPVELCINDGSANFSCSQIAGSGGADARQIGTGDLDSDGDIDLVVGNRGGQELVCLNDGLGDFSCSSMPGPIVSNYGLALGDWDGDGDIDYMNASGSKVCVNDGAAGFTCSATTGTPESEGIRGATGDIDGDGDLDMVSSSGTTCLNDGMGQFDCTVAHTGSGWGVALGDLGNPIAPPVADSDGDGVPDDEDVCPGGDDSVDFDEDGTPDACDACPDDFFGDSDGDGLCDSADPCYADPFNDADGDGLCGDVDLCPFDPDNDADGDGICGDVDACPADPANDADGDGVCGDLDVCPAGDDNADADGDGTADACDACPADPFNDADGDGVCGDVDPCPFDFADDSDLDGSCDSDDPCPLDADNDVDGDGLCGDVDACPADIENDADGDGICESFDNCDDVANTSQSDVDGDGIGDACEPDSDDDGVIDDDDNCSLDWNPSQDDFDGDGVGDVCDADTDGDGVVDGDDECLGTPLGAPVLATGCSIEQAAPCGHPWKNHGAYVRTVAQAANELLDAGLITDEEKDAIMSEAGSSGCGQRSRGRGR